VAGGLSQFLFYRANAEAQKAIKKYIQTLKDVETALQEETRAHDELRELYGIAERRAHGRFFREIGGNILNSYIK
jgi:hypothetical protein